MILFNRLSLQSAEEYEIDEERKVKVGYYNSHEGSSLARAHFAGRSGVSRYVDVSPSRTVPERSNRHTVCGALPAQQ